ncbi:MAG TPA: hypothetical protein VFD13_09345 [Candidatus Kapabacteria bacterium]|nr:hypothetical protein [Candidatus Kapabacteria bacterium]
MNPYANTPLANFDVEVLFAKGQAIFEKHRNALERDHWGEYCVIDLNSERVFTGRTEQEARENARHGAPNGFYTTMGIGFDASDRLMTFRHHG